MHSIIDKLTFSVTGKRSLEDCTTEELQLLANKYPYYSPAALMLAAKESLKDVSAQSVQKATLYVNNPLWLEFILTSQDETPEVFIPKEPEKPLPSFEEANNDELVVANPKPEILKITKTEEPEQTEKPITPQPIISELKVEKSLPKEDKLIFEPYYTVDYFASQGIKNNLDEKPKDRFSQQLKSFTEWLKTIRKMPTQEISALSDTGSEQKVVELATHSIEGKEVETEAMAEVWIKQGQTEKAVAIYSKLSLLNPSKSSYFASLIENLKKN